MNEALKKKPFCKRNKRSDYKKKKMLLIKKKILYLVRYAWNFDFFEKNSQHYRNLREISAVIKRNENFLDLNRVSQKVLKLNRGWTKNLNKKIEDFEMN